MTAPRFITRQEIASLLEVSVDTVRRQERAWELKPYILVIGPRRHVLRRAPVMRQLARLGLLPQGRGGRGVRA